MGTCKQVRRTSLSLLHFVYNVERIVRKGDTWSRHFLREEQEATSGTLWDGKAFVLAVPYRLCNTNRARTSRGSKEQDIRAFRRSSVREHVEGCLEGSSKAELEAGI